MGTISSWKLRGLSCSWIIINPLWPSLYTSPLYIFGPDTQLAKSDTLPSSLMLFARGLLRMREMKGYWELRGFSFLLFASRQKAALLGLSKWPRKSLSAKLVPLFCHSQKPTWEKMNNCHAVDASKEIPCNSVSVHSQCLPHILALDSCNTTRLPGPHFLKNPPFLTTHIDKK